MWWHIIFWNKIIQRRGQRNKSFAKRLFCLSFDLVKYLWSKSKKKEFDLSSSNVFRYLLLFPTANKVIWKIESTSNQKTNKKPNWFFIFTMVFTRKSSTVLSYFLMVFSFTIDLSPQYFIGKYKVKWHKCNGM